MNRDAELLDRITVRPDIFGGKPIVRGMRIAVEHVLGNLAAGETVDDLLKHYPFLEPEDVQACLLFAHRLLAENRSMTASTIERLREVSD